MNISVIGSGVHSSTTKADLSTCLNEVIQERKFELTKYKTIETFKSGKELRRERRKLERKNKNK